MLFFSLFFVRFFKNRLHLIIYTRVYMRKNLHISKKNLNFARCFSGKLPNRFSKILKIVYFVKSGLQKDYLKIDKMDNMDKMDKMDR